MSGDDKSWRTSGITLLFAGVMVTSGWIQGCGYDELRPPVPPNARILSARQIRDDDDQDNNTYIPGFGYYHSVDHAWYPYPFNWYHPDYGYYYGGAWNDAPYRGPVPPRSRPSIQAMDDIHAYVRTGSRPGAWSHGGFSSDFARFSRGVSRGGFGGGFHGIHG